MSETQQQDNEQAPSQLLVNLLLPVFLSLSGNDMTLAYRAAAQTINSYRYYNLGEMISVVQIIALGMASTHSLGLSMRDDAPPSMVVRLQNTVNGLIRSEQAERRILAETPPPHRAGRNAPPPKPRPRPAPAQTQEAQAQQPQPEQSQPEQSQPEHAQPEHTQQNQPAPEQCAPRPQSMDESAVIAQLAETQKLVEQAKIAADSDPEAAHRCAWATGIVQVATECVQELPNLPPTERKANLIQAAALCHSATEMLSGAPAAFPLPPPPWNAAA